MIEIILLIIGLGIAVYYAYLIREKYKLTLDEVKQWKHDCKSAYVKFGKSFEHFVPFINNFPADREKTIFLGMPIDFISFDEDSIKFIEVKTGSSNLSNKQKKIKKQILDKKIEWKELRYA